MNICSYDNVCSVLLVERVLKQDKLIKSQREGKLVFYSFNDNHVSEIFNQGLNTL